MSTHKVKMDIIGSLISRRTPRVNKRLLSVGCYLVRDERAQCIYCSPKRKEVVWLCGTCDVHMCPEHFHLHIRAMSDAIELEAAPER